MDSMDVVLAMLLAVIGSGYLVRLLPFGLPLPLVQIALGAIIAGVFKHGVTLDPELFFVLFLPPLLFLDGWRIPKVGLFRDKGTILELALGLVVFTVVGAGFLIHWLVPGMPLAVAFALAAIVAPTDPVALSAITARVPVPRRLMHILEGESLLNDASGLVCFRFAVAAAMTGSFSLATASLTFLWVALAGVACGVGVTLAISFAQRVAAGRVGEEPGSPILVNLLIPFGAYLAAEHLEASGILAAVAAGVTMSYVELSGRALATTRVRRAVVWDTVQFALNGVMFVLLGEQLPEIVGRTLADSRLDTGATPLQLAGTALAIALALTLLRLVWVWVSLRLTLRHARRQGQEVYKPGFRLVLATSLAGVRGAITMAGVLTLPLTLPGGAPFPGRDLAIFYASSVIILSLLAASVALPRLLRGLEVPEESGEEAAEDHARHAAAVAAIAAVDKAAHARIEDELDIDADVHASAVDHVRGIYEHRLGGEGAYDPSRSRVAEQTERDYRLAALQAERRAILALVHARSLSDETARKLLREIDLVEARYR
ncbi:Na+/H+ antiporter [Massilia sp. Dwa41.01b]|uniref:Na+/H+ antiporter n=1 Tax=Massilia sp. Dwa41.01b TaxID=2709302 RepID=UPI0015FFD3D4|nr:Na+/H+ antiporter [Massilia sp. Dwa41.01b]QNA89474.1 Na+/H+ antiporter [Massilia sp. Dwa41.01b]